MKRRIDEVQKAIEYDDLADEEKVTFLEGDSLVFGCDATQKGQLVWVAVTNKFFRVMDFASHTVCFEFVSLEDIEIILESESSPTIGIKRRGDAADPAVVISNDEQRDKMLGHLCKCYRDLTNTDLLMCCFDEDVSKYLRTSHGEPPMFIPLPHTKHDNLHLARNPSVKNKLTQHGDSCVHFTDRVHELALDSYSTVVATKVVILSDAALYLTDKVGKVEFRVPVEEILSITSPPEDHSVLKLEILGKPVPFVLRTRHADDLRAELSSMDVCASQLCQDSEMYESLPTTKPASMPARHPSLHATAPVMSPSRIKSPSRSVSASRSRSRSHSPRTRASSVQSSEQQSQVAKAELDIAEQVVAMERERQQQKQRERERQLQEQTKRRAVQDATLSPDTNTVLRVLEDSLRQPAFDASECTVVAAPPPATERKSPPPAQHIYRQLAGNLSSPTPSPRQNVPSYTAALPLPTSPADPVGHCSARSLSPVARLWPPPEALPPPDTRVPSIPSWSPSIVTPRVSLRPNESPGTILSAPAVSQRNYGTAEEEVIVLRHQLTARNRELEDTKARLKAYIEANEELRTALVQNSPGNESRASMPDEVEELKALLALREAEIEDLKSAPTEKKTIRGKVIPKRPTRSEALVAAKSRVAESACAYAKLLEHKLNVHTSKKLDTRVAMLEKLLKEVDPEAANEPDPLLPPDEPSIKKQLAMKHYELSEAQRMIDQLKADMTKLKHQKEQVKQQGNRLAHEVVEKAKMKAEDLVLDASTARLHLAEAVEAVEKLQKELGKRTEEMERRLLEKDREYMQQESELRKIYEDRLTKAEERTQEYERKLARSQSSLLQELHTKELELQHVMQYRRGEGHEHPAILNELKMERAKCEQLKADLRISNMQLEALCIEQAKSAALSEETFRDAKMEADSKMLQRIGELEEKLAARETIIKELKYEMSRAPPVLPNGTHVPSGPANPVAALRHLKEQETAVFALAEENRKLHSNVDELQGLLQLAERKVGSLAEELETSKRLHTVAIAKIEYELSENKEAARHATARLEARTKAAETAVSLTHEAKYKLNMPETDDSLKEDLLRHKAQVLKLQEQLEKEGKHAKDSAKQVKLMSKQMNEMKLELEAKHNSQQAGQEELARLKNKLIEMKEAHERSSKEARESQHKVMSLMSEVERLEAMNDVSKVKELERQLLRATAQFKELDEHVERQREQWEAQQKAYKQESLQVSEVLAEKEELQRELDTLKAEIHERERSWRVEQQESIKNAIEKAAEELQMRESRMPSHSAERSEKSERSQSRSVSSPANDRLEQVKMALAQNSMLDESRVNRCMDNIYAALQPVDSVNSMSGKKKCPAKQAPVPPARSTGYAAKHVQNRMKKPSTQPQAPSLQASAPATQTPTQKTIAPVALFTPSTEPSPSPKPRSDETAALYARLGLSELAPYAAT